MCLGYLVVPLALASAFARAKRLTDRHSLGLEQDALAGLIESSAYERHVRRVPHRNGGDALLYWLPCRPPWATRRRWSAPMSGCTS